jgi:phytoene dehydrogenase-like protein
MTQSVEPVIIVGGGLAGIQCARTLHAAGRPFLLLEASDRLGGRVRTERVDGFALDVGFQVLLTSYPEAQQALDYPALKLGRFQAGALVRYQGGFHRLSDPWRQPRHALATALSPVASVWDKLQMARLRSDVQRGTLQSTLDRPEQTTAERLQEFGFSNRVIDAFFRPFFGGVFLEDALQTSRRKFDYLFRLFSTGDAALPAGGMGQIITQLAADLPPEPVRLNCPVDAIAPNSVKLQSGQTLETQQVVVAVDPWAAARWFDEKPPTPNSVAVLYFKAPAPPIKEPVLVLNGTGQGPISSMCVPSQVAGGYAPSGQALISVTTLKMDREPSVLGPSGRTAGPAEIEPASSTQIETLIETVKAQLQDWYGDQVVNWQFLRAFQIPAALPAQPQLSLEPTTPRYKRRSDGILVCGDACDVASIQGAMRSGREVAAALCAQ